MNAHSISNHGPSMPEERPAVLDVQDLSVTYPLRSGAIRAVRGVTFQVGPDEVLGLVGESGSGKSTLAMAILRLLTPAAFCEATRLALRGTDILRASAQALRRLRWTELSYIPQGSMSVLNPVMRIREQFLDVIWDHETGAARDQAVARIEGALSGVNLSKDILERYPHELSGGMKQRVCIALSTLLQPSLIIADEPTSALDVVSQRVVLETLGRARKNLGASMVMIGHDMALQAQIADRVAIMFAGRFVEIGPTRSIFDRPAHPYTQRLIRAIPTVRARQNVRELAVRGLSGADEAVGDTNGPLDLKPVGPDHFAAV